jgi:hypothetical protein
MEYVCTTCGRPTKQATVIVEDRLYRSCCVECVLADKWQGVSICEATPAELASALKVPKGFVDSPIKLSTEDLSIGCAMTQWAGEVLLEHRGARQRPEGCRPWGD